MLKGCLLCAGVSVAGLLVASCAATPQSAATAVATEYITAAATQAAGAATQASAQAAAAVYNAATQAVANAEAGIANIPNLIKGYDHKRLVVITPTMIFVQEPDGRQIYVPLKKPYPTYSNGDRKY